MKEEGTKNSLNIVSKFNEAVEHGNKYLEYKAVENEWKMMEELRNFGENLGEASEWTAKYLAHSYLKNFSENQHWSFDSLWGELLKNAPTFKQKLQSLGFKCIKNGGDAIYDKTIRYNICNAGKHKASENVRWDFACRFYDELKRIISNFVVNEKTGNIKLLKTEEPDDIRELFDEAENFNNILGYKYILFSDIHGLSEKDLCDLFKISWSMVVDMDPNYAEEGGMFYNYKHIQSDRLVEHYSIGEKELAYMSSNAIHWVPVIEDKNKTDRALSKMVFKNFSLFIESYHAYNPNPVIVVVVAKNKSYLMTIKKIIEILGNEYYNEYSENGYSIKFLVLNNNPLALESTDENIFSYDLGIRNLINEIKKEIAIKTIYQGNYAMPTKLEDGTPSYINISKDDYLRLFEFAEPVYLGIEQQEENNFMNSPDDFYKGYSEITWKMLSEDNVAMKPDIFDKCMEKIRYYYNSGGSGSSNIEIPYDRGTGGTTLLKQLAFALHMECPTIMLKKYVQGSTRDEIIKLYNSCKKYILIFVDPNIIYNEEADNLFRELKGGTCPFHMVRLKISSIRKGKQKDIMPSLQRFDKDDKDREKLLSLIKNYTSPEGLEAVEQEKSNIDSPFWMNMYAFEDEFQGIELFVNNTLKIINNDTEKQQILFVIALAGWAGLSVKDDLFVNAYGQSLTNTLKRPGYELSPLITWTQDKVFKIRHYKFCVPILKVMSGSKDKMSFLNLTGKIIDFIKSTRKNKDDTPNDGTKKLLDKLFIARSWEALDKIDIHKEAYSPIIKRIIEDDPDRDGDHIIKIFRALIECYPEEVHFYAHLARYYFYTAKDYTNGHEIIKKAMKIECKDSVKALLYHVKGIGYRTEMDDYIQKIHQENKLIGNQQYNSENCISRINVLLDYVQKKCREAEEAFSFSYNICNDDYKRIYSLIAECQLYIDIQRLYNVLKETSEKFSINDFVSKDEYISNKALLQNTFDELDSCASFELDEETSIDKDTRKKINAIQRDFKILTTKEANDVILYCQQCLKNDNIVNKASYRKILAQRMYAEIENDITKKESQDKLNKIIKLYEDNIEEEPYNRTYIRNWFNSVRKLDCDEDQATKFLEDFEYTLSNWIENRKAPVEAYMYRYIVRFLRYLETNSLNSTVAKDALEQMMNEIKNRACDVIYKTNIIFWLSNRGYGLSRLLNNHDFNAMTDEEKILTLDMFEGQLPNKESFTGNTAYIELYNAYKVYFPPYKVKKKLSKSDAKGFVEFGMGFSYDGLRSYHDSIKKVTPKSLPRNHDTNEKVYMIVVKHNKFWVEGLIQDDKSQPVIINKNDLVPTYNPDNNIWPKKDEILYVQLQAQKDYSLHGEEYAEEISSKKPFQAILCSNE